MIDESDEIAWIEQQEEGVRQSIENLQAEITLYEQQLAALRAQRTNVGMSGSAHHLAHSRMVVSLAEHRASRAKAAL